MRIAITDLPFIYDRQYSAELPVVNNNMKEANGNAV